MSAVAYLWLSAATAVFVGANAVLKVYAVKGGCRSFWGRWRCSAWATR